MVPDCLEAKINTAKDFLVKLSKVRDSDSLRKEINTYLSNSTSQEAKQSDIPYMLARVVEAYPELPPEERKIKIKVIDKINDLYLDIIRNREFPEGVSAEDVATLASDAYGLSRRETLTTLAIEDLQKGDAISAIEKLCDAYKSSNPINGPSENELKVAIKGFEEDGDLGNFIKEFCLAGGNVIAYFGQGDNKEILKKLSKESGDCIVEACLSDLKSVKDKSTQYWKIQNDLSNQLCKYLEAKVSK